MSTTLAEHYQSVCDRIRQACQNSGRIPEEVSLLAVSKTKPASMVESCYQLGQRRFGENYLQDAVEKITALAGLSDIEWHFIGPLQSNKTRAVAEHFQWMETLDRDKIAQRLNEQRPPHLPPLNVLIQVNISAEPQKAGLPPADITRLAAMINSLPRLQLRGLMCIPQASEDEAVVVAQFQQMRHLFEALQQQYPGVDTLSMGMSNDLELAIRHGATQVRIGTDIFGARPGQQSHSDTDGHDKHEDSL
ncbi:MULTISPECIES: YggS family pyridoxal phosphate-dependent enzyme [unclassified Oceanobacter]|jgi:pyridoxal phosphate enzyme (YggS family)|uniref:YggS family pyridoxal phosphate-dependent enzyme n=1 Tax=unclassified Oceanobacter TaxID=2620260 RepID=UPI002736E1F1|nr:MULTISPECIES: YggS family pyridoxal phosphate-dependent enzyme [unclassified Oceanobacter]MDP2506919.1 YggS family pyridoxal phosphate-dependent enzyme [Oceanobacter sp. 3_MG-2023]MDP2608470.1 YggS family pyridoxal phosphate-dependent enzyme [Oceanobacter sp. 1_MG-2023]MDP2611565.1 YggS family pyridoxal phosphate-dependent enzyme [Oceanobacter sp. 2_MG-2023]